MIQIMNPILDSSKESQRFFQKSLEKVMFPNRWEIWSLACEVERDDQVNSEMNTNGNRLRRATTSLEEYMYVYVNHRIRASMYVSIKIYLYVYL